MWYIEETVDDGFGRAMPGRGPCPVAPPSGWSWLADLGDGVNCFFLILLKIHGDYWQGAGMAKSVPSSTVTGL